MIARTATTWLTCPECRGRRYTHDRCLCWKCEGEGGWRVPDIPFRKVPLIPEVVFRDAVIFVLGVAALLFVVGFLLR